MRLDFCINRRADTGAGLGLNTIFRIWGDSTYQTPRKEITPGTIYFVYTTQGLGQIRCDGQSFEVGKNQYLFLQARESFGYGCLGESWHFWWFEFLRPQSPFALDEVQTAAVNDFQLSLWEQCLLYAKQDRWDVSDALLAAGFRMLDHAAEQRGKPVNAAQLLSAERYIRANLESVTVASLCEHVGLKERTLRNLFYRTCRCSPKQRIMTIRLERAAELLAGTTLHLYEIAETLGFSSQFHFSRCFREHYGMSPTRYRKIVPEG